MTSDFSLVNMLHCNQRRQLKLWFPVENVEMSDFEHPVLVSEIFLSLAFFVYLCRITRASKVLTSFISVKCKFFYLKKVF